MFLKLLKNIIVLNKTKKKINLKILQKKNIPDITENIIPHDINQQQDDILREGPIIKQT
jgi:hypothetical protein